MVKQNFGTHLFLIFFTWCIENDLFKENLIFERFRISYKSYNLEARTMFSL